MTIYRYGPSLNGATSCIVREDDGVNIPFDPANEDYAQYMAWLAAGGVTAPSTTEPPTSASRLGLMRAWKEQGVWSEIKTAIAADPEVQEEWDVAIEIRRTDQFVQRMIVATGMSDADVDALLIRANELVS